MRRSLVVALLPLLACPALGASGAIGATADAGMVTATFDVPAWACPVNPSSAPRAGPTPAALGSTPLHVPHSRASFTHAQVTDLFAPPDWHPEEHEPLPSVVAHGRAPKLYACGYCHLPDGRGRPENASIAGLPAAYIVQQVKDIASGARRSACTAPGYLPSELMRKVAQQVSDPELAEAATYFSRQGLRSRRAQVIEAGYVPVSRVAGWVYVPAGIAGDEPLASRVLEMPRDFERHELRDSATPYVAYVPPGSIGRGRILATTGAGGRTLPCVGCHGNELRGSALAPPIAGRLPTYLLRQLIAFRTGARDTAAGKPMQLVVARLQLDDMIAAAAYAASLTP